MNKTLAAQLRERFNQAEAEKHQLELKKREAAIADAASRKAEIERIKREAREAKIAIRREQRKKQLIQAAVRAAYMQILKAIIKGSSTTTMRMPQDLHPDELIAYGIKAEQPKEAEGKLNKLQHASLLELEELLTKKETDWVRLLRPAWKVKSTLAEVGIAAGVEFAIEELAEIKNKAGAEIVKLNEARGRLKEDIGAAKRKIRLAEDVQAKQKFATEEKLAATKEKNQKAAQRAALIQSIASDIAPRMQAIASDFNIAYPNGQEISVLARAAFLRRSFVAIDPGFNRADFSDLEIINIARVANGQEPLSDLTNALLTRHASGESDHNTKDVLRKLESIEQRLVRQINAHNDELSLLKARLIECTQRINNLENLLRRLAKVSEKISELANDAKATLSKVNPKAIRFINGQYCSETIVGLCTIPPYIEPAVMSSYEELVWLSSADGKTFLEYLQAVLLELANNSQRTAQIVFVDGANGATELEVGGVKLSARLRKELVMLIFQYFGLDTVALEAASENGGIKVSW